MKIFIKILVSLLVFSSILNAQVPTTIRVDSGWNLLSIPVSVTGGTTSTLFSNAASQAFIYQKGYLAKDTLENGEGFWLKFDLAETCLFTGESIHEDTIAVQKGWNIIGSLSIPIAVNISAGIITSQLYGYTPAGGYQQADSIQPGEGYWVKVRKDGNIVLSIDSIWSISGPNQPPEHPLNPKPRDNASGNFIALTMSWSCTDPDEDSLTYDIYFGTDNPPMTCISNNQTTTSLQTSGLIANVVYFWRVMAKDVHGDSTIGPVWQLTTDCGIPCPGTPTVTYAGKTYNTVLIGEQCWLKENLDVGIKKNSPSQQTDNGTVEKLCFDNNSAACAISGGLYQWGEAMQYDTTEGARGICPAGWHIPTIAELYTLAATVNDDGNSLKAVEGGVNTGTNTSGFSALMAGVFDNYPNSFVGFFIETSILSSTNYAGPGGRWAGGVMTLHQTESFINLYYGYYDPYSSSVRCLKN